MMKQRSILLLFTAFILGFFYSCSDTDIPSGPESDSPKWEITIEVDDEIEAGVEFEVSVTVADLEGNRLTGEEIMLSLENGNFVNDDFDPIEGNISDTTDSTDNPGVATFSNLRVTEAADEYQLVANVVVKDKEDERQQLKADVAGGEFRVVPAEPYANRSVYVDFPDTVRVNHNIHFKVRVNDKFGNRITNDELSVEALIQKSTNNTSIDKPNIILELDYNGYYSNVDPYTFQGTGEYHIGLQVGDDPKTNENRLTLTVEPEAGTPNSINIETQPEATEAGSRIEGPPTVVVRDIDRKDLNDIEVSVTLLDENSNESEVNFTDESGFKVKTVDGTAKFDNLIVNTSGTYNLKFSIEYEGVTIEKSSSTFDITPARPNIAITTQPGTTVAGNSIEGPPNIKVQDEYGNPHIIDVTVTLLYENGDVF